MVQSGKTIQLLRHWLVALQSSRRIIRVRASLLYRTRRAGEVRGGFAASTFRPQNDETVRINEPTESGSRPPSKTGPARGR